MKILDLYKNKRYIDVNEYLSKQFIGYIIVFLGFLIMSISFFHQQKDINIIILFLLPIIYFLIKTIYSLILLLDSYKLIHHLLIKEYYFLFIIGYNIILTSLNNYYIIYYLQSIFLVLISLLLIRISKLKHLLVLLFSNIIFMLFISLFYKFDLFYMVLTFIVVYIVLIPLVYCNNEKDNEEIKYLEKCIKNNPNEIIK